MLTYSTHFISFDNIMLQSTSFFPSITDHKRVFNIDAVSITEYFFVLASDGKLDRGILHYGQILFKDNFLQHIATSRRFLQLMTTAKCRAEMGKTTVHQMSICIDATDKLNR